MHKKRHIQEVTVVCCVEAGALEQMTVRMVASLRLYGGIMANAPVLAITPRRGPKLSKATQKAFQRYDVEHISIESKSSYNWNNFINKPQALLYAIHHCKSDVIVWLDSDIIVTDCLGTLLLDDFLSSNTTVSGIQYEFATCPVDKNIGTTGKEDQNDVFWKKVCSVLDVNYEQLPYVKTCAEGVEIKWYFNSGVFSFKRESGFAEQFNAYCHKLLHHKIASNLAGVFFTDQICMGLAAYSLGLKTKILQHRYNFAIGSREKNIDVEQLKTAAIIHYHDALWPHEWEKTLLLFYASCKNKYNFIKSYGVLKSERNILKRIYIKFLLMYRSWKLKQYLAACKFY